MEIGAALMARDPPWTAAGGRVRLHAPCVDDWKFNDPAKAHLHVITEEAFERVALVQVEDIVARCKQQ